MIHRRCKVRRLPPPPRRSVLARGTEWKDWRVWNERRDWNAVPTVSGWPPKGPAEAHGRAGFARKSPKQRRARLHPKTPFARYSARRTGAAGSPFCPGNLPTRSINPFVHIELLQRDCPVRYLRRGAKIQSNGLKC